MEEMGKGEGNGSLRAVDREWEGRVGGGIGSGRVRREVIGNGG